FQDPLAVLRLAREVGHAAVPDPPGQFHGGVAQDEEEEEERPKRPRRPGSPEVEWRRVVATRQSSGAFGPLLAACAWGLGLLSGTRRAFLGDGAAWIWKIQQKYFPRFVPVVDFLHALSYVFAAALAGRKFEEGWEVYQEWIGWLWGGQVGRLL